MEPLPSDPFERKRQRLATGAKPRVLDICGGAGGFSLGFMKAGFSLMGAIESDPIAVATYVDNLHKDASAERQKILATPRDLQTTSPGRLVRELELGPVEDAVDIVLAGLPCQAFARIGRPKLGSLAEDPAAYRTDPRAGLYRRFLRYVRVLKPLSIVLENVPDILNHGGHNVPEEISSSLAKAGYVCRYTLLNAACYGVPQLRERLFLIAHHRTVGAIPEFPAATHNIEFPPGYAGLRFFALKHVDRNNSHYVPAPAQPGGLPAVSTRKALRDLAAIYRSKWQPRDGTPDRRITQRTAYTGAASAYGLAMRQWEGFATDTDVTAHVVRHTPRDYRHFSAMRHGEQYPEMYRRAAQRFQQLLARRHRQGQGQELCKNTAAWRVVRDSVVPPYDPTKFPNKWRKLEPDRPSCTLTAHLGKDSYSHIHYDSDQGRTISVREAARLQSFPDGFIFHGSMNSALRQIGNAVPPLLAYAIALEIARALGAMNANATIAHREAAE
jgi:DNA (cytosine-5)-methyltransferase 1